MMSNRTTRFAPATLQGAANARGETRDYRDERAVYERYQRRAERVRGNRDWLDEQGERVFGNES